MTLAHIGKRPSNPSGVVAFIDSLWDKSSKLYANTPGAAGSLKATANALLALDQLSQLAVPAKADVTKQIRQTLEESVNEAGGLKFFSLSVRAVSFASK